jgi:hypothetical protein
MYLPEVLAGVVGASLSYCWCECTCLNIRYPAAVAKDAGVSCCCKLQMLSCKLP